MKQRIALIAVLAAVTFSQVASADDTLEQLGRLLGNALNALVGGTFQYLEALPIRLAVNYTNSTTNSFARSSVRREHGGYYNIAQVCDIWDRVIGGWVYSSDPYGPFDQYFSASETIQASLRGDCDDFAILVAACIRAIGGTAMIMSEVTSTDGHAYTCVYIGSDQPSVVANLAYVINRYDLDISSPESWGVLWFDQHPDWGYWLNLDWQSGRLGSSRWAPTHSIVHSRYMPTPSILGLLQAPVLVTPAPEEALAFLQAELP